MFDLFTDPTLTCCNIMKLFHDEFPSSEADILGTYLNIPQSFLKDARQESGGNSERMMIAVLNHWLDTDEKKSWTLLAEAVEFCKYFSLAEKVRNKESLEL